MATKMGYCPAERSVEESSEGNEQSLSPETGDRFLREGLSGLQQTPPDGRLAYVCLSLCGRGLRQLMVLCDVKKLLSIDISDNKLTSLYPVRLAANLVYLNASNNQISSAAELSANAKLEHVDLRRNLITSLGDWQFNVRLRVLRLGGNKLDSLKCGNLTRNSLLRELDVSNNAIESLEQLPYLKCLDTLDISSNSLKSLDGIQQAPLLVVLHAQGNQLTSLHTLELGQNRLLREMYIHENPGLNRPLQLLALKSTEALQSLQVSPGPMTTIPQWRLHCIHLLPQLLQLDGRLVTAEEQFAAAEAFGSLEYAQRRVWESLIPDEPFVDRRLLKLCSKKQSMSCPKKPVEGTLTVTNQC